MKVCTIIFYILLILTVIAICVYMRDANLEHLQVANANGNSSGNDNDDGDGDGDELKNKLQLPGGVFRQSNTILTAVATKDIEMDKLTLPEHVKDTFTEWIDNGFISLVKDQMLCGGCWAFATLSTLTERLTIATNGKWNPPFGLSEQVMISCGEKMGMKFYYGCGGGIPQFAIDAIDDYGVPPDVACEECGQKRPDSQDQSGSVGRGGGGVVNPNNTSTCTSGGGSYASTAYTYWQSGCDDTTSCKLVPSSTCPCNAVEKRMLKLSPPEGTEYSFHEKYKSVGKSRSYTRHGGEKDPTTVDLWPDIPAAIIKGNVDRMKKAIYYEGPITIGYRVTSDFHQFKPKANNYYKYNGSGSMMGGHAVSIVGWKKVGDTPVWICKNSWGENWGYGFPNGPKRKNPMTGAEEPKYKGGFWNHIMGINDSFIESNASGAYPDIHNPNILKHLANGGKDIPLDWPGKLTIRDIYEQTKASSPSSPSSQPSPLPLPLPSLQPSQPPLPLPSLQPSPSPLPSLQPSSTIITVTPTRTAQSYPEWYVNIMGPVNISPQSMAQFLQENPSLFLIGTNVPEHTMKIVSLLPRSTNGLSQADLSLLITRLSNTIDGYVIVILKSNTNTWWYIHGNPTTWKYDITSQYIHPVASIKRLVSETFGKYNELLSNSSIAQISKKIN